MVCSLQRINVFCFNVDHFEPSVDLSGGVTRADEFNVARRLGEDNQFKFFEQHSWVLTHQSLGYGQKNVWQSEEVLDFCDWKRIDISSLQSPDLGAISVISVDQPAHNKPV